MFFVNNLEPEELIIYDAFSRGFHNSEESVSITSGDYDRDLIFSSEKESFLKYYFHFKESREE